MRKVSSIQFRRKESKHSGSSTGKRHRPACCNDRNFDGWLRSGSLDCGGMKASAVLRQTVSADRHACGSMSISDRGTGQATHAGFLYEDRGTQRACVVGRHFAPRA
jgi:hypothetical protein